LHLEAPTADPLSCKKIKLQVSQNSAKLESQNNKIIPFDLCIFIYGLTFIILVLVKEPLPPVVCQNLHAAFSGNDNSCAQ
jgi:hypothetical protein